MTVKSYRQVVDEDDSVTNSETYETELKPVSMQNVMEEVRDGTPVESRESSPTGKTYHSAHTKLDYLRKQKLVRATRQTNVQNSLLAFLDDPFVEDENNETIDTDEPSPKTHQSRKSDKSKPRKKKIGTSKITDSTRSVIRKSRRRGSLGVDPVTSLHSRSDSVETSTTKSSLRRQGSLRRHSLGSVLVSSEGHSPPLVESESPRLKRGRRKKGSKQLANHTSKEDDESLTTPESPSTASEADPIQVATLSNHFRQRRPEQAMNTLEEASKESSLESFSNHSSFLQFDPTREEKFTRIHQSSAPIISEMIKHETGIKTNLLIREAPGLPVFETDPTSSSLNTLLMEKSTKCDCDVPQPATLLDSKENTPQAHFRSPKASARLTASFLSPSQKTSPKLGIRSSKSFSPQKQETSPKRGVRPTSSLMSRIRSPKVEEMEFSEECTSPKTLSRFSRRRSSLGSNQEYVDGSSRLGRRRSLGAAQDCVDGNGRFAKRRGSMSSIRRSSISSKPNAIEQQSLLG